VKIQLKVYKIPGNDTWAILIDGLGLNNQKHKIGLASTKEIGYESTRMNKWMLI